MIPTKRRERLVLTTITLLTEKMKAYFCKYYDSHRDQRKASFNEYYDAYKDDMMVSTMMLIKMK